MIRISHWLVLAIALVAGPASASGRAQFEAFGKGVQGLDGQFTQRVYDGNGQLKEETSGRVALSAPRLFRWEYLKPYPQLIVADGETVWVYDPDLEQVSRRPQGAAEQDSPLAVLIDPGRLDRDYIVEDGGTSDGLSWMRIRPRAGDEAGFESARIGLDASGVSRMDIVDTLGQRTEIVFRGWKRNPAFARDTFRFTPPAGVDVIGGG
jgi:outer membrane lipoprotein carrier protein